MMKIGFAVAAAAAVLTLRRLSAPLRPRPKP
jgi:hypothetical protein